MAIIQPGQLATGSYNISGSFSGSFAGSLDGSITSASYAETSSFAVTASFALNGGGGGSGLSYAIVSGSVTASVDVQDTIFLIKSASNTLFTIDKEGSTTISGSAEDLLLIKNQNNTKVLNVSQSGVVVLSTQSAELTTTAPNGGIYFTSTSFFVGLD